jgi:starch synthase
MHERTATGIVFTEFDDGDYRHALRRAIALYADKRQMSRVRQTGMRQAFDWSGPAQQYTDLYHNLIGKP